MSSVLMSITTFTNCLAICLSTSSSIRHPHIEYLKKMNVSDCDFGDSLLQRRLEGYNGRDLSKGNDLPPLLLHVGLYI
ncbi:hypothetical protein BDZ89DRAFT_1071366 [Hymenopellis radicata]|nr:hypothetical protein BDZ89DRAFT_1071366 [Hymenopellis radicata]